ncbi:MAG: hypothetical protein N2053_12040 [Chitinispirillaceae bacterium]|nr:hypothetical protein [Chitinispirillaceae bacterium]
MKKSAVFLIVCLLLSCFHNDPSELNSLQKKEIQYGSCVVRLPQLTQLALAKKGGKNTISYKFLLTISGEGMETMTFSWTLDSSGETYTIDKIPAGKSRLFKGILSGSNGVSYEGSAYADIYAGQITYVTLVLRKTGSAQVEVIIEDFESEPITICYKILGYVDTANLEGLTLKIEDFTSNSVVYGYFYKNNIIKGKFYGRIEKDSLYGEFSIEHLYERINGYLKARIYPYLDYSYFKGEVFDVVNTTNVIGIMDGERTVCIDTIQPSEYCVWDTAVSDTCIDARDWIDFGKKSCAERGLFLNRYSFQVRNGCNDTDYYNIFCFECCTSSVSVYKK